MFGIRTKARSVGGFLLSAAVLFAGVTADAQVGTSRLTNQSGGNVAQYRVVVADSANDLSFTTTTTERAKQVIGVVYESGGVANGSTGRVATYGVLNVDVAGTVTRGDYLITSDATAGKAESGGTSDRNNVFAIALETGTDTTIEAILIAASGGGVVEGTTVSSTGETAGDVLVADGANAAAWLSNLVGAAYSMGADDTVKSKLTIYAGATSTGAELELHNSAANDTDTEKFIISAGNTGNLHIAEVGQNLITFDVSADITYHNQVQQFSSGFARSGSNGATLGRFQGYGNGTTGGGIFEAYNGNDNDANVNYWSFLANSTGGLSIGADGASAITITEAAPLDVAIPGGALDVDTTIEAGSGDTTITAADGKLLASVLYNKRVT